MTRRMRDRDLARLFENTFPNTLGGCVHHFVPILLLMRVLDTTIRYFDHASGRSEPQYDYLHD